MTPADLVSFLEFARSKTRLLDSLDALPDAATALGWRPAPGRAHIAWQLMHIAATDDRHLNARMKNGEPANPDYVRRFAGGSVPDDTIPTVGEIRRYLEERRVALLDHLKSLSEADLTTRPKPDAPWAYTEWFQVLTWHEAHHQGQAHLTLNLYRASAEAGAPKTGH